MGKAGRDFALNRFDEGAALSVERCSKPRRCIEEECYRHHQQHYDLLTFSLRSKGRRRRVRSFSRVKGYSAAQSDSVLGVVLVHAESGSIKIPRAGCEENQLEQLLYEPQSGAREINNSEKRIGLAPRLACFHPPSKLST